MLLSQSQSKTIAELSALEKMLANQPYFASDPTLVTMRRCAEELLYAFNQTRPSEIRQRQSLIQQLFDRVGSNSEVHPTFRCDYGCHIRAGDDLYINYDCVILDCNWVTLGDRLLLGPRVQIYTAYHPTDPALRRTKAEMAASVTIGDDVWIGGGAIICPGVTIGDNTTIGAGSVVTADIPANVVAVGNPCRVMRQV
ncbi:MAG: sugar O-acetyltransferase [Elainellaceae cyanobacterium]